MSAVRDPVFGCLLAQGRRDRDGYAFHGKTRAHIVAWVAANGPVPDGRELEHTCRRRHCCEPRHLEPVTRSENEKRKRLAYRLRIRHCPRGHELGQALMTAEGGRCCRTCLREVLQSASPIMGSEAGAE